MAELIARLDQPAPIENLDETEKIIKKAETASKLLKTKKTSKKKVKKSKENKDRNIQPPPPTETHEPKVDRFPQLSEEVKFG